jgi:hypothetical protein
MNILFISVPKLLLLLLGNVFGGSGAPAFGSQASFGSPPTFGGAASFGSPNKVFGSPPQQQQQQQQASKDYLKKNVSLN